MKQLAMTKPWSSVDEVAKYVGVAQHSIYRWIEAGGRPAHKIGRLWKLKLSEVDKWDRAGRVEGYIRVASKAKSQTKWGNS